MDNEQSDAYEIDFDTLTVGEVETLEDVSGVPFAQIGPAMQSGDRPTAKILRALAIVSLMRQGRTRAEADEESQQLTVKALFGSRAQEVEPALPPPPGPTSTV